MAELPPEVKRQVRSVLLSKMGGVKLKDFQRDYQNLMGSKLDFNGLGFKSLVSFMKAIPDVARLEFEADNTCRLFGVVDRDQFSFVSPIVEKAQGRNAPDLKAIDHRGKPNYFNMSKMAIAEKRDVWKQQLVPNMQGLYAVCFKFKETKPKPTREEVTEQFGRVGNVIDVSFTPRYAFIRYKTANECLKALEEFEAEHGLRVPEEKSEAKHVIKGLDKEREVRMGSALATIPDRVSDSLISTDENDPNSSLVYVGHLPENYNKDDLARLFTVNNFSVVTSRIKESKGKRFGFVQLTTKEQAEDAVKCLHRTEVEGSRLIVNLSYSSSKDIKDGIVHEEAKSWFQSLLHKGVMSDDGTAGSRGTPPPLSPSPLLPNGRPPSGDRASDVTSPDQSSRAPASDLTALESQEKAIPFRLLRAPRDLETTPQESLAAAAIIDVCGDKLSEVRQCSAQPGHQKAVAEGTPVGLFIPRIPTGVTEEDIKKLFEKYSLVSVRITKDMSAILKVGDVYAAERAIEDLHWKRWKDVLFRVVFNLKFMKQFGTMHVSCPEASSTRTVSLYLDQPHSRIQEQNVSSSKTQIDLVSNKRAVGLLPNPVSLLGDPPVLPLMQTHVVLPQAMPSSQSLQLQSPKGQPQHVIRESHHAVHPHSPLLPTPVGLPGASAVANSPKQSGSRGRGLLSDLAAQASKGVKSPVVSSPESTSPNTSLRLEEVPMSVLQKMGALGLQRGQHPQSQSSEDEAPPQEGACSVPKIDVGRSIHDELTDGTKASSPRYVHRSPLRPQNPMLNRTIFDTMLHDCCPAGAEAVTNTILPETIEIIVTLTVDCDTFWGQLHFKEDLQNLLQLMCSIMDKDSHLPYNPDSKRFTAQMDGEWYRVWLLETLPGGDEARVYFIDYGNVEVYPARELRCLPDEHWGLYPIAVPFRVTASGSILASHNYSMESLCMKKVQATVVKTDSNTQNHVIDIEIESVSS